MQINSNIEQNLAKAINTVTTPKRSRSYELCVKADAMRFAKLYRESVKCYLDSIMMDRNHQEAYWGLASSYKYLKEYKKAIKMLEKLVELDDRNEKIGYKIREARLEKTPYIVVVGDKEVVAEAVGVRSRKEGELGQMAVEAFVEKLKKEIESYER